jgi:nitrate reductase molybdenum cofactor assembly chaperone NarJ/NarW
MTITDGSRRRACAAIAELLSYPRGDVAAAARLAAEHAAGTPAAEAIARFGAAAAALHPTALEELYTRTFDLAPACAPYLGVQLLGDDDPARGPFLARLVEVYAADGHHVREELPDHVAEVLAFLAVAPPGPGRDDLVVDALLPALDRMLARLDGNPYRELLDAARTLAVAAPVEAGALVRATAEAGP